MKNDIVDIINVLINTNLQMPLLSFIAKISANQAKNKPTISLPLIYFPQQPQDFLAGADSHLLHNPISFSDGLMPNIVAATHLYSNPSNGTPHFVHFFVIV